MDTIKVERTGRIFSFGGVEYMATMPNGDKTGIWSPPWGEEEDDVKDAGALNYAHKLWERKDYKVYTPETMRTEFVKYFGEGPKLEAFLVKHFPFLEKSTHRVEVLKVKFEKHPNADRLSVAEVFGYTCCVNTEDWKNVPRDEEGKVLVAYIPPDNIVDARRPEFRFLQEKPVISEQGELVGKYIDDSIVEVRTKAKRLRGIVSYGFLIPAPAGAREGDNVAAQLDVRHYEPELAEEKGAKNFAVGGEEAPAPAVEAVKYDVDALRRYSQTDVFELGEPVLVTEKLDGSNARFVFDGQKMHCGSKTEWKLEYPSTDHLTLDTLLARGVPETRAQAVIEKTKNKAPKKNLWWYALSQCPALEAFCRNHPGWVVYGEVFARQGHLKYTDDPNTVYFAAFDLFVNGRWLDAHEARTLFKMGNVPVVPFVAEIPYDFAEVCRFAEGPSLWRGAKCIREGVVVKPLHERRHRECGRVNLKVVSVSYSERYR